MPWCPCALTTSLTTVQAGHNSTFPCWTSISSTHLLILSFLLCLFLLLCHSLLYTSCIKGIGQDWSNVVSCNGLRCLSLEITASTNRGAKDLRGFSFDHFSTQCYMIVPDISMCIQYTQIIIIYLVTLHERTEFTVETNLWIIHSVLNFLTIYCFSLLLSLRSDQVR